MSFATLYVLHIHLEGQKVQSMGRGAQAVQDEWDGGLQRTIMSAAAGGGWNVDSVHSPWYSRGMEQRGSATYDSV